MLKNKFFSAFLLVYLLYEPIMYSIMELTGQVSESGQMRLLVLVLSALAWVFYLPVFKTKDLILWVVMLLFGIAFYGTSIFEVSSNSQYNSHFLRWASTCVSFVALGLTLRRKDDSSFSFLLTLIPVFTVVLTFVIAKWAISGATDYSQYTTESGLTYQSVSYYMALFLGLNSYYLLSSWKKEKSRKLMNILAFITMLFNVLVCFMSGGRGGAILLLVYLFVLVYELSSSIKINRLFLIFFFALSAGVFLLLSERFNLTQTAGFSRTFSYLENDNRTLLWRECASHISESPIFGHGIGSDFYVFGYYSHNIVLDFLLETGIVGTILLFAVFIKVFIELFKQKSVNRCYLLPFMLFLYALVFNCFSGYWVSTQYHWFALGFAYYGLFSASNRESDNLSY